MQSNWLPVSNAVWLGTAFVSKFPPFHCTANDVIWLGGKNELNFRMQIDYNKTVENTFKKSE